MNIAFFGANNIFSETVFGHLSNALAIKIVIFPNKSPFIPPPPPKRTAIRLVSGFNEPVTDIETLAQQYSIPLIYYSELSQAKIAEKLVQQNIDLIVVACFPFLIPESLLNTSAYGAINIHPSMLPRYRGPAPLFWQLQKNEISTGVSLHSISQRFDAGRIVLQRKVNIPNDASGKDIDSLLATSGAKLVTTICTNMNTLQQSLASATPQTEQDASYQGSPCASTDFYLDLNWSAQHVYRFMRGTQHLQTPYLVKVNNVNIVLTQPISFSEKQQSQTLHYENKNILTINFKRGCLRAKYKN